MIRSAHTHPKNCPDQGLAAVDRKRVAAAQKERAELYARRARAEWFDWYPPRSGK